VSGSAADRGKEHPLAAGHRDLVVLASLEAERARHAAATGVGNLDVEPQPREHLSFAVQLPQRLVMAVPVEQSRRVIGLKQSSVRRFSPQPHA